MYNSLILLTYCIGLCKNVPIFVHRDTSTDNDIPKKREGDAGIKSELIFIYEICCGQFRESAAESKDRFFRRACVCGAILFTTVRRLRLIRETG